MLEIRKTRQRLVTIYTLVMGMILTIVIITGVTYLFRIRTKAQQDEFQKNVSGMIDHVKHENMIRNDWLSNQEIKNHYIVHIEDNGKVLKWHASWMSAGDRQVLLASVADQCQKEGMDLKHSPISYTEVMTKQYRLKNDGGEDYYASASMIPMGEKFRSLILIQNFEENTEYRYWTIMKTAGLTILMWLILLGINHFLIEAVLKPIREGRKKQTEFVACASHELKAPLAVIQSSTGALLVKPGEIEKYSHNINNECRRMAHLIDDLLLLASTETNTWKMKLEQVDVDTLMLDLYESYETICAEHGMRIRLDTGEELTSPIMADPARLSQVLVILLDNAVQYSESKEPLELMKTESRNYVYLSVIDHGVGIPKEMEEHIFDKFYRGDHAHRSKEHYGLGLSIAKELIRLQGGMLSYLATPKGGASFVIKLGK